MMRTLRECPEINTGTCTHVDVPTPPGVLVHRADDKAGTMLFLHNLGDQDATVDVSSLDDVTESPSEMLADREYGDIDLAKLSIGGYGYRWICLRRGCPGRFQPSRLGGRGPGGRVVGLFGSPGELGAPP